MSGNDMKHTCQQGHTWYGHALENDCPKCKHNYPIKQEIIDINMERCSLLEELSRRWVIDGICRVNCKTGSWMTEANLKSLIKQEQSNLLEAIFEDELLKRWLCSASPPEQGLRNEQAWIDGYKACADLVASRLSELYQNMKEGIYEI